VIESRNLAEKKEILYALAPFSDGVKVFKRRADLVDYTYSDLRLYGSKLSRGGVEGVLDGITVAGVPVFEHRLCEAHRKLLSRFADKLDMGMDTDGLILNEFCTILAGASLPPYREGSPLLYHLDFVPGDDGRISQGLAEMFAQAHRLETDGDFCLKAAVIHTGIVRVYPYADGFSELAARAAMQYELIKAGYFPVDIGAGEQEYNSVTGAAIRTGEPSAFAALLRTAVFKKLHILIDAVERGV
jgi:hypothetical protein